MVERDRPMSVASRFAQATTVLQPFAPLVARLVVGEAFVFTGLGKWKNLDTPTALFTQIGIPAPHVSAGFIATLELVGGACLVLGLGTRVFSLLLSASMVVALMTADRQDFLSAFDPNAIKGFMDVTPIPFLIPLLWLVGFGPGPISVDRVLCGRSPDPY
jgi:putative oxidoreductase